MPESDGYILFDIPEGQEPIDREFLEQLGASGSHLSWPTTGSFVPDPQGRALPAG